jgi:hypothetical protein
MVALWLQGVFVVSARANGIEKLQQVNQYSKLE